MRISDTLSGRKDEFMPGGDPVKMYVCGVTPYSECHIGHVMSYIIFDVIRRYLEFRGYQVKHVQNFTDIDDKIIARSNQLGIQAGDLADQHIKNYFKDMDALNIKRAHVYPKATAEIPKIIEVVQGLIDKGHAYQSGGDVYFRVRSFPGYGKLSHRSVDEMRATEDTGNKEHPMDFALWKAAKPNEPCWESPWGLGRPGWHIECSAMCLRYLGSSLDIHGGGQDLVFPHHENEIAQSEAFTGSMPFVRYWLHNGLLQLGGEKMSKSVGNLITVQEALARWSPDAVRLFVLSSHYRSPLTYSEEGLDAAERGVGRLRLVVHREGNGASTAALEVEPYRQRFLEAMDDDFNTPQAVATLFDLSKEINRLVEEGCSVEKGKKTLVELAGVLGLTLPAPRVRTVSLKASVGLLSEERHQINRLLNEIGSELEAAHEQAVAARIGARQSVDIEADIELLVSIRSELRNLKKWALADRIRRRLADLDVILEDTDQGTVWRYRR